MEVGKKLQVFFGLFQTLGDVIVSTALIRTIKEKYPESEITYAVGVDYVAALVGNPDISNIIPCGSPQEIIIRSAERPYDKVYLPLMLTQEDTLWHQRYPWCTPGKRHNLIDMYAYRCQDDLKVENRRSYIYPTDQHWDEIVGHIPDEFKEGFKNTPFITIHTNSRLESKDWPMANFAELSIRLMNHLKGKVLIYQIGGPSDPVLPKPVTPLTGTPLLNTAAIIKRSLLHIDVDSGPSFIADSLDVPTICIMGATNPDIAGPIGPNTTFIEPPVRKCIGTATHTVCVTHCLIKDDCIKLVSVDEVYNKVIEKLDPIIKKLGIEL